jgi:hypothetical protein
VNLTNLMNRGALYAVKSPRDTLNSDGRKDSPPGSHLLIITARFIAMSYLRDDSNRALLSVSALSYFNALFFTRERQKIGRCWLQLLKKSKLLLVLVAAKVLINAQCDQDRFWSAFERK